jgi:hypothetical protein
MKWTITKDVFVDCNLSMGPITCQRELHEHLRRFMADDRSQKEAEDVLLTLRQHRNADENRQYAGHFGFTASHTGITLGKWLIEQTREREFDARLAEMIGWSRIKQTQVYIHNDDFLWDLMGHDPDGNTARVPFFHGQPFSPEGEQAKAILIEWLGRGLKRWDAFADQLILEVHCDLSCCHRDHRRIMQFVMQATPVQVARAAVKSIKVLQFG